MSTKTKKKPNKQNKTNKNKNTIMQNLTYKTLQIH